MPAPAALPLQPRPFPPPSLAGVPMEYVFDQLRNFAPYYWKRPETADCTIVIPVPQLRGGVIPPSMSALFPLQSESFTGVLDSFGRGRRATQPATNFVPQISFKLHVDYLSAHSSYLRGLFSGANPLDLVQSQIMSRSPASPFNVPADRMPRLLPSTPQHPVLFLPVPDPSSFHLLIHWIYFGRTDLINDCLHQGLIQWEGIARNVEYLGLSSDIKLFLGSWYNLWVDRSLDVYGHSTLPQSELDFDSDPAIESDFDNDDDDDESDTLYSDTDDDDDDDMMSIKTDISESGLCVGYYGKERVPPRGRSRESRPL